MPGLSLHPLLVDLTAADVAADRAHTATKEITGGSPDDTLLARYEYDGRHRRERELIVDVPFSVWTTKVEGGRVAYLVLDGQFAWAGESILTRLSVQDGASRLTVRLEAASQGVASCHGRLLTWDWDSIRVWRHDEQSGAFDHVGTIPSPPIALAASFGTTKCLLISIAGQGMLLDLAQLRLTREELVVTTSPPAESEPDPTLASPEQLARMAALARQISRERRDAILSEANQKKELTPKQRVEWAIAEMELVAAGNARPDQ